MSLFKIAFWQTVGLIGYCGFVAQLFAYGNEWFGSTSWWGSLLFLVLFVMSALVSVLVTLGYTVYPHTQKAPALKAGDEWFFILALLKIPGL